MIFNNRSVNNYEQIIFCNYLLSKGILDNSKQIFLSLFILVCHLIFIINDLKTKLTLFETV